MVLVVSRPRVLPGVVMLELLAAETRGVTETAASFAAATEDHVLKVKALGFLMTARHVF